jgi:hypothetical protein
MNIHSPTSVIFNGFQKSESELPAKKYKQFIVREAIF